MPLPLRGRKRLGERAVVSSSSTIGATVRVGLQYARQLGGAPSAVRRSYTHGTTFTVHLVCALSPPLCALLLRSGLNHSDVQELAEWLHVPLSLAAEWLAVATFERLVGYQHTSFHTPAELQAAATQSFLQLQACSHPQQALYCAQLLHALGAAPLAVRQLGLVATSSAAATDPVLALQVSCLAS